MTPDERKLILSLVVAPGRNRDGSPEEVLRHFGTDDGQALGSSLLRDAVERQDELDVEAALIICFAFGFTQDHLEPLVQLCSADWHFKHEDVVTGLGKLNSPDTVEALYQATQSIPKYLDYDESRALATKAIWALGGTSGPESGQALVRILDSGSEILRNAAQAQIERRAKL